jgi:hypothetical protein
MCPRPAADATDVLRVDHNEVIVLIELKIHPLIEKLVIEPFVLPAQIVSEIPSDKGAVFLPPLYVISRWLAKQCLNLPTTVSQVNVLNFRKECLALFRAQLQVGFCRAANHGVRSACRASGAGSTAVATVASTRHRQQRRHQYATSRIDFHP